MLNCGVLKAVFISPPFKQLGVVSVHQHELEMAEKEHMVEVLRREIDAVLAFFKHQYFCAHFICLVAIHNHRRLGVLEAREGNLRNQCE